MTIDDLRAREAIRATLAKCAVAGDRLKADDYAACFAVGGIIQSERAPGDYHFRHVGREAIRAWQQRWLNREPAQDTVRGASFVRHHLATSRIDLTGPASAKVRTYWVAWTDIGPDHAGYYVDEFCSEGDAWLIANRVVRRNWSAPGSRFVSAGQNNR